MKAKRNLADTGYAASLDNSVSSENQNNDKSQAVDVDYSVPSVAFDNLLSSEFKKEVYPNALRNYRVYYLKMLLTAKTAFGWLYLLTDFAMSYFALFNQGFFFFGSESKPLLKCLDELPVEKP